jgi:hypothetical protein
MDCKYPKNAARSAVLKIDGGYKVEDKTLAILEKYLDGDFRVSPMAANKASIKEIQAIEKKLKIKFPEEYIAHLLAEGSEVMVERGLYIEAVEEIWPRPKQFDAGPFWSFLYGLHTFTPSGKSADWMRLEVVGRQFMEETGIKAAPILTVIGDADLYCVDKDGKILRYNHEENSVDEIQMDFWELFEKEVRELKERAKMMKDSND